MEVPAMSLGLVLYECLPHIPPIIGRNRNTLDSCPGMALSSLKDRQYSYSSKWNNPDTYILVRKPELDVLPLQSMEGHLQTNMQLWVDNNNIQAIKYIYITRTDNVLTRVETTVTILWSYTLEWFTQTMVVVSFYQTKRHTHTYRFIKLVLWFIIYTSNTLTGVL